MLNLNEIGKLIADLLNQSNQEGITLWLVEEETGESVKLYDFLNSEKNSEDATFKRIN